MCVYVCRSVFYVSFNFHFLPNSLAYAAQMQGLYYLPKHVLKHDADWGIGKVLTNEAIFFFTTDGEIWRTVTWKSEKNQL
jgi:hypothetical protein